MIKVAPPPLRAEILRGGRFLVVGCAGLAVDTAVFALLQNAGAHRAVGRAISLAAATCVTWSINRKVTFGRTGRRRAAELGRYALVALIAQGFNYGLFLLLGALAPGVNPLFLIPVCAAAAAGLSYAGQRFFTFAPTAAILRKDTV